MGVRLGGDDNDIGKRVEVIRNECFEHRSAVDALSEATGSEKSKITTVPAV